MNSKLNYIQNWAALASGAKWSVQNLAKVCAVSERTLERWFVERQGQNPKTWLTAQRQKKATELLHDHNTVKETASLIGHAHASTFAREYKKQTGLSPSIILTRTST